MKRCSTAFHVSCLHVSRFAVLPIERPPPRRRHLVDADLRDALFRGRDRQLAEVLHETEVDHVRDSVESAAKGKLLFNVGQFDEVSAVRFFRSIVTHFRTSSITPIALISSVLGMRMTSLVSVLVS